MTERMIENRVKKLQAIEAQQKELEAQAAGRVQPVLQGQHQPPIHNRVRKAPCINAVQSQMQEATTPKPRGPGAFSVPRPPLKYKEKNQIWI